MRKAGLAILSALALACGCNKLSSPVEESSASAQVKFSLLFSELTKATADGDGLGANINHWVVEVRDVKHPEQVFYRKEKDGTTGVHEQTFDIMLVRNQTYDIAFWADVKGEFDASTLSKVTMLPSVGNSDDVDAFCCCLKGYTCQGNDEVSAVLTRALAQINFISTDLKEIESHIPAQAYANYNPVDFSFMVKSANAYDVFAGASIESSIAEREFRAPSIYGTFSPAAEKTTLFMAYVFTDQQELKDVKFAFKANESDYVYNISNVPLKKNYRTNVFAKFFSGFIVKFNITVNPDWNEPEQEVVL